jgi:hypothetical protein
MRAKSNFASNLNARHSVQSPTTKIFLFRVSETDDHIRPSRAHYEGVSRSPRHVVRDAMDVLKSQASDDNAYGQAV